MMDDERYKKQYNNARDDCLCRGGDNCGIPTPDTAIYIKGLRLSKSPPRIPPPVIRECLPDRYLRCPLFVFIKKIPCNIHNRW